MYDGYRGWVFRRLVTPRWLGALVLAALFAVACYHLGWWQYDRHLAKAERNERLDEHYRGEAVPLGEVLTPSGLAVQDEWRRVTVTGTYEAGPVFVRGRSLDGEAGLEVLWGLRPDAGGPAVVVNRGFVRPSDQGASVRPSVPPAPDGEVTVTGWARRGEASRGKEAAAGTVASINLPEVADQMALTDVLPDYVLLDSERTADGTTPQRPQPLGEPDRSLGTHLAYAYQWWMTMALGFVLIWFGIRRELRAENPEQYPPKVKKTRIWDEEDE